MTGTFEVICVWSSYLIYRIVPYRASHNISCSKHTQFAPLHKAIQRKDIFLLFFTHLTLLQSCTSSYLASFRSVSHLPANKIILDSFAI